MIFQTVNSINNIPVRLTYERLYHIIENHDDMAGKTFEILETIANPDIIFKAKEGELLASRQLNGHWLIVVYREQNRDGFIITAFETTKINDIKRIKKTIWVKKK